MTPATAKRLFDELTNAELMFLTHGTPHHVFLAKQRHKYLGETRREMDRIVRLGPDAKRFVDFFLTEFDGCY